MQECSGDGSASLGTVDGNQAIYKRVKEADGIRCKWEQLERSVEGREGGFMY
jgi:hypothetical protein